MFETIASGQGEPDERLVRHYLMALSKGAFLDALNAFSMDASFRDESGRERRGIREIAASFARHERVLVEIETLEREGDAVTVRLRIIPSANRTPKTYRSVFRVRGNRIDSLVMDPLPAQRSRRTRLVKPS